MAWLASTAAIVTGTALVGWPATIAVGLVVGLAQSGDHPVRTGALAGIAGWGVLLLWNAAQGPVGELAAVLGGVLGGLPAAAVFALTLLFAALLAASAAGVGQNLRGGGRAELRSDP